MSELYKTITVTVKFSFYCSPTAFLIIRSGTSASFGSVVDNNFACIEKKIQFLSPACPWVLSCSIVCNCRITYNKNFNQTSGCTHTHLYRTNQSYSLLVYSFNFIRSR